jgi:hypothetical protein
LEESQTKIVIIIHVEKVDDTPGPNAYLVKVEKSPIACTMSGRHDTKTIITPGPKYFPTVDYGPSPKYSFGSKQESKIEVTPSPLDYDALAIRPDAPKGPAFSIRQRLDDPFNKPIATPAPNAYYPKILDSEKKVSLKGMHKEYRYEITPGPANYNMPSCMTGPQVSLCARYFPFQGSQN